MLAIDTETTGVFIRHGCRPFFVSTCDPEGRQIYWEWPVDPTTREVVIPSKEIEEIQDLLDEHARPVEEGGGWLFHNAKFDLLALQSIGIDIHKDICIDWLNDTMIASHVLHSQGPHGLKDLALYHLEMLDDDEAILKDICRDARRAARSHGWDIARAGHPHIPIRGNKDLWKYDTWLPRMLYSRFSERFPDTWESVLRTYALKDAERTMALWMVFKDGLWQEELEQHYRIKMWQIPITLAMEDQGITAHRSRIADLRIRNQGVADYALQECRAISGYPELNLRSFPQLQDVLFEELGVRPRGYTKTGYSVNAEAVAKMLDHEEEQTPREFLQHLVDYRGSTKLLDYLESYELLAFEIDDQWIRIHPWFNPTGTGTTRLSSQNPNAQNIAKKENFNLRDIFGPLPGRYWLAQDYSNIELRIFAWESGDKELIRAFERGESVHLVFARILWPDEFRECERDGVPFDVRYKATLYQWTKNGNFSLIYGAGPNKADTTYHQNGAYALIRNRMPLIDKFLEAKTREVRRRGFVTTLGGYRLYVPEDKPHAAVNYFVQGSAGWAITLAMMRMYQTFQGSPSNLIMQIHDELVSDHRWRGKELAIQKARMTQKIMELSGQDISIPLPVKTDIVRTTWAQGESLEVAA